MKNSKIIARFGLIIALIICAYYIDALISRLGLPIRIAVTTIIVVMTLCQLFDYKTAIFSTTMFGLISFTFAFIMPNATSYLFVQPLISIFPRIMIGVVSYGVFILMLKLFKNNKSVFVRDVLSRSIAAASGVLTNTILVITMISIANNKDVLSSLVQTIIAINFCIEFLSAILVVPILSLTVKKRLNISHI